PRDRVFAYSFRDLVTGRPAYWRDVGTVDAYWLANMELLAADPEVDFYGRDWPLWTYQPQMPPAQFVVDVAGCRGVAIDSLVSSGCVVAGATVRHSILFSDVCIDKGAVFEDSIALPGVRIGRNCRIHRAIIDSGCRVADDAIIGFDRAADAA